MRHGRGLCVCVQVLEEGDCKKLGMNLFLGVAQGSDEPLRFIHLTYTPEGPVTHKACAASAGAFA
jgi:leucyl aminopeptidase